MDRPEDRRNLTHTETYYPHPAEGLDVDKARERVEANPEVMPPHPRPRLGRSWQNREILGMRAMPLLGTLAAALGIPLLVAWLSRMKPRHEHHVEHEKAHRGRRAREGMAEMKKRFAATEMGEKEFAKWAKKAMRGGAFMPEGLPRFVILASRPWGKKGKKARALVLGKVTH